MIVPRLLPPGTNILFVGDNVGRLKDISFDLQRAWCGVLWKTTGLNGVLTAALECPDLIICEMELPDVSGLDVCRMVRADSVSSQIPIVLVGESAGADFQAFEAGADEYFSLSEDPERLLDRIYRLIERRPSESRRHYKESLVEETNLSTVMKETDDLLRDLDREDSHVGLGRRRILGKKPDMRDCIDLKIHLIGIAADFYEEEVRELLNLQISKYTQV